MKTQNIRRFFSIVLLTVAFVAFQSARVSEIDIAIQVSPNVLNLNNQGEVVTIHTDIAYGLVLGATVTLNEIEIAWWKSDDRGNFVAKFVMEAVKNLPLKIGEYNTLTLSGTTIYGEAFTGSQEVKVVNNIPVPKK